MCKTSDDTIDEIVGQRIRNLRIKKSVSQKDLGNLLGVTFQQIQKYETGKNTIAISKLIRIANFFNISIMEMLDGLVSIDGPSRFLSKTFSSRETEIIHIYHAIEDASTKSAFLKLGRALAKADFSDD